MHRNHHAGLDVHGEVQRAGVVHRAHARVQGEERKIYLLAEQGGHLRLIVPLRLLDFLERGNLPPVPQVQVACVKQGPALQAYQKGNPFVRGAVGGDVRAAQRQRIAFFHVMAAVALGHIASQDIMHHAFVGKAVNAGIEVVGVRVADEKERALIAIQQRAGHAPLFRRGFRGGRALRVVEDQQRILNADRKAAMGKVGDLYRIRHSPSSLQALQGGWKSFPAFSLYRVYHSFSTCQGKQAIFAPYIPMSGLFSA